ncbi:exonuclease SbcD [Azoarcus sp. CIB]|uniref:exonuclease SbcCD subunit D C-terminal domain-containing protein n=1 Tax=Aromatoleum sp. (strain CIB) TaxID=198107 RepID=UPI00067DFE13|nr:exonuclease SbcCD subunit D C-terminal domain-containing protein [Azoarcus sp. CIB]AKU11328.1 exonuclease SbcD [Azoarcus sp. CIB]
MRLLHTSDWHLGQTLHDFDRSYEHAQFLDWLLAQIEAEAPDALLIAGDVFDTANPSAQAQHQFARFLTAARERAPALNIVVIAGNHDSPGRLEATRPFLELFDASVVGQVDRHGPDAFDLDRLVVPLKARDGEVRAWCIAMPFLRPGDVPRIEGAADAYLAGVAALYQRALANAQAKRLPGQAIVAMGHCHMVAGKASENSERRIVIGGAEALPADVFDVAIAYTALGHLHLAQQVNGQANLRYSGSPLPMSFAEIDYPHQIVCVELEGETAKAIRPIRVPRSVELLRVPKTHAPLDEALAELAELDLSAYAGLPPEAQPFLEVRVRLDAPEPGLRARIEDALAGQPVRLARIDPTSHRAKAESERPIVSLTDLEKLEPEQVFERLCGQRINPDLEGREEMMTALRRAFAELQLDPSEEVSA